MFNCMGLFFLVPAIGFADSSGQVRTSCSCDKLTLFWKERSNQYPVNAKLLQNATASLGGFLSQSSCRKTYLSQLCRFQATRRPTTSHTVSNIQHQTDRAVRSRVLRGSQGLLTHGKFQAHSEMSMHPNHIDSPVWGGCLFSSRLRRRRRGWLRNSVRLLNQLNITIRRAMGYAWRLRNSVCGG